MLTDLSFRRQSVAKVVDAYFLYADILRRADFEKQLRLRQQEITVFPRWAHTRHHESNRVF